MTGDLDEEEFRRDPRVVLVANAFDSDTEPIPQRLTAEQIIARAEASDA